MITDSRAIGFLNKGLVPQAKASSKQNLHLMASTDKSLNATLTGDSRAGTKQIAPEDGHPEVVKRLKLEIASNLNKILSVEAKGIAEQDSQDILAFIEKLKLIYSGNNTFMADAKSRVTQSVGQLADVVNTNAVTLETGNSTRILTGNDIATFRSLLWRGGTAIRMEAPLILDSAHNRVILAHTLLQQADLLTQRATNLLSTVADNFAVAGKNIALIANETTHISADSIEAAASTKIKVSSNGTIEIVSSGNATLVSSGVVTISGTTVNINPVALPQVDSITPQTILDLPEPRSRIKKHLELPQWEGMSPLPAFITSGDEPKMV